MKKRIRQIKIKTVLKSKLCIHIDDKQDKCLRILVLTDSNIYGTPADTTDYWLSAISLGSGGISGMLSEGVTKSVLKTTENVATGASGIKTTRDEYKNK